jgi:predicted lipoprotein with Yx(FWY)xxD motif
VLCLLVAGCGNAPVPESTPNGSPSSPQSGSFAPRSTSRASATPSGVTSASATARSSDEPAGTVIMAAESDFGTVLHDASGQPIYLFDAESSSRPKCYDDCAKAWPPVLTSGAPRAKGAVHADLLGTTHRSDGSTQITYAGHPLYFYAHEGKFQVLCHNVEEFGGTWLAVQPNGRPAPS